MLFWNICCRIFLRLYQSEVIFNSFINAWASVMRCHYFISNFKVWCRVQPFLFCEYSGCFKLWVRRNPTVFSYYSKRSFTMEQPIHWGIYFSCKVIKSSESFIAVCSIRNKILKEIAVWFKQEPRNYPKV